MKTIVCIKELDTASDLNALVAAVDISDEVTAITMGPESSKILAGEAVSRGADKAIVITDNALKDSDTLVTAKVLARTIELIGDYDMIMLGNESNDSKTAQVGPMIAEILSIEQITNVMAIEKNKAVKIMDGKKITVNYSLPVLMTVNKRINQPDVYNMGGIFKEKDIKVVALSDLGIDPASAGANGSQTRITGEYDAGFRADGEWIEGSTNKELAESLISKLRDERAI